MLTAFFLLEARAASHVKSVYELSVYPNELTAQPQTTAAFFIEHADAAKKKDAHCSQLAWLLGILCTMCYVLTKK